MSAQPETNGASREEKLARNQALFRDVNERINELASRFDVAHGQPLDVICECSDATCTTTLRVAVEDYERVRGRAERFLICPRHDVAVIERIVDRGCGYEIVEMLGEAAAFAAALDPRSPRLKQDRAPSGY